MRVWVVFGAPFPAASNQNTKFRKAGDNPLRSLNLRQARKDNNPGLLHHLQHTVGHRSTEEFGGLVVRV